MNVTHLARRRPHAAILLIVPAVLALAACAIGAPAAPPGSGSQGSDEVRLVIADGPIVEPGLTVSDALDHRATDDLVSVTGALFVGADGAVRLCEAMAESFPPQCGGSQLAVEGLDLDDVAGLLQTEGNVSWAERVTLFGSVE